MELSEKRYFQNLYRKSNLLIKSSGEGVLPQNIENLTKNIRELLLQGTKITLIHGAGKQIDAAWRRSGHTEERPKRDGVALTTPEVLYDAVLPAEEQIQNELAQYFDTIDHTTIPRANIRGEIKDYEKMGFTGTPVEVENLDFEKTLQIIGFTGVTESGQELNINGDEIAKVIVKTRQSFDKVIFATESGGVLNTDKKIVHAIALEDIPEILKDFHPKIKVEGGMRKKLEEAAEIAEQTGSVVITDFKSIHAEIMTLLGAGTLIYSKEKSQIIPLPPENQDIFDLTYNRYVESGDWKKRSMEEQALAKENHHVLKINKSIIGGFSLIEKKLPTELTDQNIDALSFECWWAGREKNGIGSRLIEKAIEIAEEQNKPLVIYTKEDLAKHPELTKYEGIQSENGATLWTTSL